MTITDRPATIRAPMDSLRKTALVAGAFYILTFVSIPSLALYSSVRAPNYILGAGPDTPSSWLPSWRSSWRSPASAPRSPSTRC